MNIFYQRPLFLACMACITVSTAAYFAPVTAKYVILAIFAAILLISVFMLALPKLNRTAKHTLMYALLCSAAVVLALSISLSYFNFNEKKLQNVYGNEHTVNATVLSVDHESEFYSIYTVVVNKLNNEEDVHKAKLICEYNACLKVGESASFRATASQPEDKRDGIFNEKLSMISDGMFVIYTSSDSTGLVVTDTQKFSLKVTFAQMNYKLSRIITDRVDGEAGNLSSAILLGNKNLLSSSTERDFRRAGVSHILALSGMHITIIMGALSLILWKLTDNSRRVGIISSVIAVFYLALTGFSLSATRAVLMLLIVYLGMIISSEPDPLTSLSVAGVLIITIFPGAIVDAGFWLSFGATFGILVFMPPFHEFMLEKLYLIFKGKHRRAIVHSIIFVLELFAASIFAIIPLIVVMCIFIKEMSWFSILSSAVLGIPSSALILFSLLLVCFNYVPYFSVLLAQIIEKISEFMLNFCADVSQGEGVVFSLNYPFIWIMAIVIGAALLYCVASNHRIKPISAIPLILSLLIMAGTITVYENQNKDNVKVTFVNASSVSNLLVLSNENQAIICDLSNGSNTSYSKVLDELYDSRVTEIKAIMLTGYTYAHAATYYELFASETVRQIWLPRPDNSDEYSKMKRIYDTAKAYGVEALIYGEDYVLKAFDDTKISVFQDTIKRSEVPVTLISITANDDHLVYASPAFNECELEEVAQKLFESADYVIFGNKGPKVKTTYKINDNRKIDAIIFANEDLIANFDSSEVFGAAYFHAPEKIVLYLEE